MLDTSIQVKTDHFDGPLGLLLLLVQKEEMDVRSLDLTKITKQYLDYLAGMQELNFDLCGDYLFLAATLLLLKSKNCVSEEEEKKMKDELESGGLNITTQAELIRRLEELQHFQKMGEKLWSLNRKGVDVFVKPKINRKEIVNSILTPIEMEKLTEVYIDFLFRQKRKYTVVKRDRLSIKEKLQFLKDFLEIGTQAEFFDMLEKDGEKGLQNKVITFISLLELARLQRIKIFQNDQFSNIYVDVVKSLNDFDVTQADGFEPEDTVPAIDPGSEELNPEVPKELVTSEVNEINTTHTLEQ